LIGGYLGNTINKASDIDYSENLFMAGGSNEPTMVTFSGSYTTCTGPSDLSYMIPIIRYQIAGGYVMW
jgi:hypothetical protein